MASTMLGIAFLNHQAHVYERLGTSEDAGKTRADHWRLDGVPFGEGCNCQGCCSQSAGAGAAAIGAAGVLHTPGADA